MESVYLTFLPIGDSGTLDWDQVDYVPYQNATITYAVTPFTLADYDYYIRTYEINTGLVDTNTITANSGIMTESLDGWAAGSYYSLLTVVDKSDGTEYTVAYDVFDINDEVMFEGYTYNAETGTALDTTDVNFIQSSTWYNITSNASGYYNVTSLSAEVEITLNASKTNFTHEAFTFTPILSSMYTADLYLFPANRTLNGTSIVEGMTVDYPLHQGVGSAAVTISNDTWSNTTTSNALGYYQFNLTELVNGTYTVNAIKSGYDDSQEYSVIVIKNQSVVQNVVLSQKYVLTVRATDSQTGASLSSFTAAVDGNTNITTSGEATFSLGWGLYSVSVTASDYYPGSTNELLNQNRTATVSLSRTESQYYAPHYVRFVVYYNGIPSSGFDVTVTEHDDTDSVLSGITGTDGSVGFRLTQDIYYDILVTNDSISESFSLYPVESSYNIYLGDDFSFAPGNVSSNLTTVNITYYNESFSLQNITGSYLTSSLGFNALSQGVIAGGVNWIVVGAGGPFAAIIATVIMATLGILSWAVVLFITMTIISIWVLAGNIG